MTASMALMCCGNQLRKGERFADAFHATARICARRSNDQHNTN